MLPQHRAFPILPKTAGVATINKAAQARIPGRGSLEQMLQGRRYQVSLDQHLVLSDLPPQTKTGVRIVLHLTVPDSVARCQMNIGRRARVLQTDLALPLLDLVAQGADQFFKCLAV